MAKHHRPEPTGVKVVNPAEKTIEAEIGRHYTGWESSHTGRRVIANLKRQSKEWEAKREATKQQADFETSIAPVVAHARANFETVRNDPQATQLEVEQAEERWHLLNLATWPRTVSQTKNGGSVNRKRSLLRQSKSIRS